MKRYIKSSTRDFSIHHMKSWDEFVRTLEYKSGYKVDSSYRNHYSPKIVVKDGSGNKYQLVVDKLDNKRGTEYGAVSAGLIKL